MEEIVRKNKIRKTPLRNSETTNCKICFVLLEASLFVDKSVKGKKELLTEEKIASGKCNPISYSEVRPDIIHNSLLMLLDSPLCKSGCLTEIIISTSDGKIMKINPKFRVPRSFKIFNKVFSEFLTSPSGELKLPNEDEALINLTSESLENYFQNSDLVIGFSRLAKRENLANFMKNKVINGMKDLKRVVFVLGATSTNNSLEKYSSYYSYYISICELSIPTYICCSKICSELEEVLEIF